MRNKQNFEKEAVLHQEKATKEAIDLHSKEKPLKKITNQEQHKYPKRKRKTLGIY